MNLKNILAGTGVAIVTPFLTDKKVDYDALEKLINFQIDKGVNYIVSLGTTGETPVLKLEEKIRIINFTSDKIKNRVPLVVGIGGNNTQAVIDEIKALPLDGTTAILSTGPYYNKPTQEGIFQHYKAIAEAAPKPIILYNVPGRTTKNMTAETTLRLAVLPNIAGIKEASGDMMQCMEIIKDAPKDFLIVSGDDVLAMAQLACGIDGVISVVANCFPKEFSDLVNAGLAGDFKTAKIKNDYLLEVYNLLFIENNPAGAKAFLFEMGLIKNELRLPLVPASETLQQAIHAFIKR
jgi:4-hydroxy-tetrahydrodipicolinate synthase